MMVVKPILVMLSRSRLLPAASVITDALSNRAEKPPIGKRLKGMFSSKYDKNGLLILKEEDFIY